MAWTVLWCAGAVDWMPACVCGGWTLDNRRSLNAASGDALASAAVSVSSPMCVVVCVCVCDMAANLSDHWGTIADRCSISRLVNLLVNECLAVSHDLIKTVSGCQRFLVVVVMCDVRRFNSASIAIKRRQLESSRLDLAQFYSDEVLRPT